MNPPKMYSPRKVEQMGLILGEFGKPAHYQFILKLIKTGRLKAKNVAFGKTPYFLIPEHEIERYNKELTEV